MKAINIKINHLYQAFGISGETPTITWICEGGMKQTAFQVIAKGHLGTEYDSKSVNGSEMLFRVPVNFKPRECVSVFVTLFDENGLAGETSLTSFEVAIQPSDFTAEWINPENYEIDPAIQYPPSYLKKSFIINDSQNARLYATAHGVYTITVNGKRLDDFILAPGSTQYDKMLQYQAYDVSHYLKKGENELLVFIGDGWYRGTLSNNQSRNHYGTDLAFLAQLEVDGKTIIKTDATWLASQAGPVRAGDLMHGETYDARMEKIQNWHEVKVADFNNSCLCISDNVPVKEQKEFSAKLFTAPNGKKVLDFGQNIAGYVKFSLNAKEGHKIILRHAETLDKHGNAYFENYQPAKGRLEQIVDYTCKYGQNTYKPSGTFFGFRYAEVECDMDIDGSEFTAVAVYSDMEFTSEFSCGNKDVEQLYRNSVWSLKGNVLDVPTDCPTREKSGFGGDIQVFIHTMLYLCDGYAFTRKWLRDYMAGQDENGNLRCISPSKVELDFMEKLMMGSPGWGDAIEILPDRLFTRYNDLKIIQECYESVKKWTNYFTSRAGAKKEGNLDNPYKEFFVDSGFMWGEWLEPGSDPMNDLKNGDPEAATAFYSYAARKTSEFARLLGKTNDEKKYAEIAENARKAYRCKFVVNGRILNTERMCRYIRPIIMGMLEESEKAVAAADLNALVIKNDYKLNTGFLTTHELNRTLSEYGYVETAYKLLLNEQYPGWLYEVKKGATTILENWDSIDDEGNLKSSFNHYAFGSITGWLFDCGLGIRVQNGKILIKPTPYKEIGFMKGSYLSPLGKIESAWEYEKEEIRYSVTIPVNCRAKIILPSGEITEVSSGKHSFVTKNK